MPRQSGLDPKAEQTGLGYATGAPLFSVLGVLLLYAILGFCRSTRFGTVAPDLALNTTVSFR